MTDIDKINNLYSRIKSFEFPDCENEDFKKLVMEVSEGFLIIQKGILNASEFIKSQNYISNEDHNNT